jgi:photosystem II stability/assembly factor-like uncharacterized protein
MRIWLVSLVLFTCSCERPSFKEKQSLSNSFVELKEVASPTKSSLRGISIPTSKVAWLSGAKGTIIRSMDAGKSWDLIPPPDNDSLDFRDIEAFSENLAIIISAGYPSRIYRTENGGSSWKLVHENLDSAAFMNSVYFRNAREGIVFGDVLGKRHLILKTSDGGKNWRRILDRNIPEPLANENGFAASGSCIAVDAKMNYFIGLGGEKARIFSSPKGEVWKAIDTPFETEGTSSGFYSIASGNNKLIAMGGDYAKPDSAHSPMISTNGVHWNPTEGKVNGYRSVVDFCTTSKVWVCGGTNGMDYSINGGKTWMYFSDTPVNTLRFFPNSAKAIAANSSGNIFLLEVKL